MKHFFTRRWSIKLHNKILLALVFGAIFGATFNISKYKLEITYHIEKIQQSKVVENWESIEIIHITNQTPLKTFGHGDQLKILSYFQSLPKDERKNISIRIRLSSSESMQQGEEFRNVTDIQKVKTIAVLIKPIGTLFIRLLMFLAIPLVVSSLIVGAASLGDIRKIGRIGAKTIFLFLLTTAIAITIGIGLANIIEPGKRVSVESREKLMVEFQGNVQARIQQVTPPNIIDTIIGIVPTNPISAMANAEMLQVVFFALIVGVTLTLVAKEKAQPVVKFFDGFSETMIKMVDLIMNIAPFGVFALISATVGEFGFDILQTLIWYALTLIFGLILQMTVVYGSLVKFLSRMNPLRFFKGMRDAMLIAFSTSSSAATLPVNMECCEKNLGVPKETTSFVLPLGATINMDGTAMYQAVAAVFIAQVYGLDLHLTEQLTILLTATLASIGTAPVPGVGIVMLIIVLRSVNIPEEGIALILGIDRILDMCRTVSNITGDAMVATVIARSEGNLSKEFVSTY